MLLAVAVLSAFVSLASSSLLSDLDGTAWDAEFGTLSFDVNSSVCGTAGGRFADTGLLEDLLEESSGILTGIWTEDFEGTCAKRRPSGRNRYGRFVFKFDEDLLTFSGTWAFCDEELERRLPWHGTRASRSPEPLAEENCPELYGGPTPPPVAAPTATPPDPPPLDYSRRPPGPPITVDLVGDKKSDGTYGLVSAIDIGPVSKFGSDGRLIASESGDAIIYALLQLVVVIAVGELSVEIAKIAAERSISLASWNRLRAYEATLSPITSLVQVILTARTTVKHDFRLPSRSTVWGTALGLLVIAVDLGLLLGSQYSSREYTKDEVFAPVVLLGSDATRGIPDVPMIVEIPLTSESPGFAFNRNLWLSARTVRNDVATQSDTFISLATNRNGSSLNLWVFQNDESWSYLFTLAWRSRTAEGASELALSLGTDPEQTLASWLLSFGKQIADHRIVRISAEANRETILAAATLNSSLPDPAQIRFLAGQYLLGSLSLTNEVRQDVPYGAVVDFDQTGAPLFVQRDFSVAVGQKPRMTTKVLFIVAGFSTFLALVVVVLLWRKEGHDVSLLIKQHFGLHAEARLWKVGPESDFRTMTGSNHMEDSEAHHESQ